MNAVAASLCANVQDRISDSGGLAKKDLIAAHQSEGKRVDQRIQCVTIVEGHFAADRGDAKCVSIVGYACHHPRQQRSIATAVLRMIQRTESQTVQRSHWSRSHCENIAQDPADACSRALKGFYK